VEDGGAADGEADYGCEGGDQHDVRAEVEDIGKDGGNGEEESEYVEPERGVDRSAEILAETELQQESGESDGGYDDQGERTGESAAAGVDDDQGEREKKEAGGEDGPASGRRRGARVGSGVGQGVSLLSGYRQELYKVSAGFSNDVVVTSR
jgi:hypothetical protein